MPTVPHFEQLEHSTRFTFVRHGESEANKLKVIQGHSDSPLSDKGREHASAAGRALADAAPNLIYTSPLSRSHETARIISRETAGPDPIVLEELKELDTGTYSGRTLADSRNDDPEAFARFRLYSWDAVDGAESRESLHNRAVEVWRRLIEDAASGARHLVCVTHGGMLQWLIKSTIASPDHRWMPVFGMANCGISTFVAQSTSLGTREDLPAGTGFFGNWEYINRVPY
jgi:broad specificity phosphatase PhoE